MPTRLIAQLRLPKLLSAIACDHGLVGQRGKHMTETALVVTDEIREQLAHDDGTSAVFPDKRRPVDLSFL